MWIIQIFNETLQIVVYVMKEEEMLSKMVYSSLLYVLPVLNYEGVNFAHFWMSEIDQNKPKLDVNYSNLERKTA